MKVVEATFRPTPGDRIERLSQWFAGPASWLAIGLALAAACVVGLGPLFATPGLYIETMPHDSLSMADIGYRLARGQTPGRDFHSAFGILFQGQMGLAMEMGRTVSRTLKLATLLFVGFSAPFAAYLARTRLSNMAALAVVFGLLVLGCAPYAKADRFIFGVTFAMLYNREAWSLLTLAALFWLAPRRPTRALIDGALLGLLTAACIYIKVSYGGVALLLAAAWLGLRSKRPTAALGCGAAMIAVAAAAELFGGLGFNLRYLSEILFVARSGGGRIPHIAYNLFDARFELAIACILIPLAIAKDRRPPRSDYLFVLGLALASLLIVWQNAQVEGLVLLWAGVAALLERALAAPAAAGGRAPPFAVTAAVLYASWAGLTLAPSLLASATYVYGALTIKPQDPAIPMIADVRFQAAKPGDLAPGAVDGVAYAAALKDGVALLSACPSGAQVFTVDLFDPFAMLTGRPSDHAWTWQDPKHSFTRLHHPSPDSELGSVDCVMIPRQPTKPASTSELLAVFGDYIERNFPRALSSADWTLRLRAAPSSDKPQG